MGFLQAGVLTSVCFFLGVLCVCFNVDYRILHLAITDQAIQDAKQFYTLFYNAPPAIKTFLHSMIGVGIFSFLGKLHKWDESAVWFDGSSLAVFVFAICVYISVIIANLQNVVNPHPEAEFTLEQSLNLIGAGNTIVIVLLLLVLVLQGGQEYASRLEAKNVAATAAEEQAKREKEAKSQ